MKTIKRKIPSENVLTWEYGPRAAGASSVDTTTLPPAAALTDMRAAPTRRVGRRTGTMPRAREAAAWRCSVLEVLSARIVDWR